MASEKELDELLEEMLNPTNSLFPFVGKRGLDEVLGSDYNPSKKSIRQIKKDIMKIGKRSGKKNKIVKAADGGVIKVTGNFKGTF